MESIDFSDLTNTADDRPTITLTRELNILYNGNKLGFVNNIPENFPYNMGHNIEPLRIVIFRYASTYDSILESRNNNITRNDINTIFDNNSEYINKYEVNEDNKFSDDHNYFYLLNKKDEPEYFSDNINPDKYKLFETEWRVGVIDHNYKLIYHETNEISNQVDIEDIMNPHKMYNDPFRNSYSPNIQTNGKYCYIDNGDSIYGYNKWIWTRMWNNYQPFTNINYPLYLDQPMHNWFLTTEWNNNTISQFKFLQIIATLRIYLK